MRPALSARATRLGPAFDLIANYAADDGFFFEREGLGISATGVAHRISADLGDLTALAHGVHAALAEIAVETRDGPSPVAVGAIPFDLGAPVELIVPERVVGRGRTGETCQLDVWPEGSAPADERSERWTGRAAPSEAFEEMQLSAVPTPEGYASAVERARQRIRAGELSKVVLARTLEVRAGRELDAKQLLWRLRAVDPHAYAFAVPTRDGTLVGASPELLVNKHGDLVEANPLAGSAPRSGDPDEDRASGERLLASAKDREEHAFVREAVADALEPLCAELSYPSEPRLLGTANVWHLSTPFRGRLRSGVRSVLDVVAALHPTPAVCGTPRCVARRLIAELEPFDRGSYSGPVGWVDANGDGEWAIALRCAEIAGERARLFAGAGIVAGSVPESEVDETERKFRAFLDSLRWG